MRIRGTEVARAQDFSEQGRQNRLRDEYDRTKAINDTPPKGSKTYMNIRQRNYRRAKRGV